MKKILTILILIITLFSIQGCTGKQNSNSSDPSINKSIDLSNSIVNEELEKRNKLTLIDLKNLLETSYVIEVKDINNRIIGQIATDENIIEVIEDIFSYDVVNNYENFSKEEVVATINFHIDNEYPIYGLIKEKFIYIEGYYFITNSNRIQEIINYFKINTETDFTN